MTEYQPKALMADIIVTVTDGHVSHVMKVPWLNEERADIAIFTHTRKPGQHRWWGVKVLGTLSPWGGYHAVEKWAAQFSQVIELHMTHDVIEGYGRF